MTYKALLAGISALAFTSGMASAQTTVVDGANNSSTTNCVGASPANNCTVNNSTTYNATNTRNTGSASATSGTGNNETVNQNGNTLYGSASASGGDNNTGFVTQGGNNNSGSITANGTFNNGTIDQSSAGANNNNIASISQAGSTTSTSAPANSATVRQAGSGNSGTITQTRTAGAASAALANLAYIEQGTGAVAGAANSVRTTQNGTNLTSYGNQWDSENTGLAISNNRITVSQTGIGSTSTVYQDTRGTSATVTMLEGGLDTGVNTSFIEQRNNRVEQIDATTFSNTTPVTGATMSNSSADVAIRGLQNSSSVTQNGVGNSATVTLQGGGTGNTGSSPSGGFPANRREGNTFVSRQTGRGNSLEISAGGATSTNSGGARGNLATVTQGDATVASSDISNARNMSATIYQRGTADTVTINQQNNSATINGVANTLQFGSYANVSQLSAAGSATINQNGFNSASVTQGLNQDNSGGFQVLNLTQNDLGDTTGAASSGPFGGGGGTQVTSGNTFQSAQYGTGNGATITQSSVNASSTLFQARGGVNNTANLGQGDGQANSVIGNAPSPTGANSVNLVQSITQSGNGGTVYGLQDGTNNFQVINQSGANTSGGGSTSSGNLAVIYQNYSYQSATVNQTGYNQVAAIVQAGQSATANNRTVGTIGQTGNGQNAVIQQTGTSGASAAGDPASSPSGLSATTFPNARAAGVNSAEAVILQTGSRNSAYVTQNGRGQYARIEQNGVLNSGTITQDAAAANAVAILEQNGNGNTYTIAQGAGDAGAYIRVQQTGDQNAATSTTVFGTGATGAGSGAGAPNAGPF